MRTVFSWETFNEGGQLYCQGGRGNKSGKRLYITVGKVFKEYVRNNGMYM